MLTRLLQTFTQTQPDAQPAPVLQLTHDLRHRELTITAHGIAYTVRSAKELQRLCYLLERGRADLAWAMYGHGDTQPGLTDPRPDARRVAIR
jgi:hypothetical protein